MQVEAVRISRTAGQPAGRRHGPGIMAQTDDRLLGGRLDGIFDRSVAGEDCRRETIVCRNRRPGTGKFGRAAKLPYRIEPERHPGFLPRQKAR